MARRGSPEVPLLPKEPLAIGGCWEEERSDFLRCYTSEAARAPVDDGPIPISTLSTKCAKWVYIEVGKEKWWEAWTD